MGQQCIMTAKANNSFLGCVRQSVASSLREGIFPLCSPCRHHVWRLHIVFSHQYKGDRDTRVIPVKGCQDGQGTGAHGLGEETEAAGL